MACEGWSTKESLHRSLQTLQSKRHASCSGHSFHPVLSGALTARGARNSHAMPPRLRAACVACKRCGLCPCVSRTERDAHFERPADAGLRRQGRKFGGWALTSSRDTPLTDKFWALE
jgi:hypothetical protein